MNKHISEYSFNPTPYESHMLVYGIIKENSSVLDIGCASGYFAKELKKKNCITWCVDNDRQSLNTASKYCQRIFMIDLEQNHKLPLKEKKFDYVLLMDILEHMSDPAKLLNLASKYVKKNGFIIISTPNIAFLSVRLSLMFGNFNYRDTGIMDRGHKHFFTKKTLSELVKQSHLKILSIDYSSGFSQIPFIGKYINRISKYHQYQITRIFGTLLGYQIILVSQK